MPCLPSSADIVLAADRNPHPHPHPHPHPQRGNHFPLPGHSCQGVGGRGYDPAMNDDIRRIQPEDREILEEWLRETDEPEVRAVGACRVANWQQEVIGWPGDGDGWTIDVWAMEFVRSDPLETELRQRIANALRGVSGVTHVAEHDRESWFLTGTTSGETLISAAAQVIDELADQIRRGEP
jgi:hypothetical protein